MEISQVLLEVSPQHLMGNQAQEHHQVPQMGNLLENLELDHTLPDFPDILGTLHCLQLDTLTKMEPHHHHPQDYLEHLLHLGPHWYVKLVYKARFVYKV